MFKQIDLSNFSSDERTPLQDLEDPTPVKVGLFDSTSDCKTCMIQECKKFWIFMSIPICFCVIALIMLIIIAVNEGFESDPNCYNVTQYVVKCCEKGINKTRSIPACNN